MTASADRLRRAITRAARNLRRLRAPHGISAAKLSVLGQLHRTAKPIPAATLARLEKLQPQSLTRLLAELGEQDLIARHTDPSDGRQMLIHITQAGTELLTQDARAQNAWLAQAMSARLTPTEQAMLLLAAALLDRLGDDDL